MIIYVYTKCSTCQKALSFLSKKNIPFVQKEITTTPPTKQELEQMLRYHDGKIQKLFNTSGILYRQMELAEKVKTMTTDEALTLLCQHGMLVKRPFLLSPDFGLTGFNEPLWAKHF